MQPLAVALLHLPLLLTCSSTQHILELLLCQILHQQVQPQVQ
jgi:hypothetical protein